VRVCLVYDCLYPHTVGGAERWYRHLGERLAAEGHEVTYLTLRQWQRGEQVDFGGVRVRSVGPRMRLYVGGRRRILPPVVFGLGVLAHMLRRRRAYDLVHTASFPYFSLLAIGLVRPLLGFELIVDWHEVWTRAYWREYLGRLGGWLGWWVQRQCMRFRQRAFCFSRLHAARLRSEGFSGDVEVLEGEYAGPLEPVEPLPSDQVVVFAGRLIPEKQAPALIPALARARDQLPGLSADLFGDGPERSRVEELVAEHGLHGVVRIHGFAEALSVEDALGRALCMVLPSRREGYGLIVVEASSRGTPSVVVAGADNAAVELIEEGVNGFVARSASADDLSDAILRVSAAGWALRASTAAWFAANARRLSLEGSLERVLAAYIAGRSGVLSARR
jgi:glycosyltransferase involved in cell wall biosynthesis